MLEVKCLKNSKTMECFKNMTVVNVLEWNGQTVRESRISSLPYSKRM